MLRERVIPWKRLILPLLPLLIFVVALTLTQEYLRSQHQKTLEAAAQLDQQLKQIEQQPVTEKELQQYTNVYQEIYTAAALKLPAWKKINPK